MSAALAENHFTMNVTCMLTRYSVTFAPSTLIFISLTHAPWMFFTVFDARSIPFSTASSKLFLDVEEISITFAMDTYTSLPVRRPLAGVRRTVPVAPARPGDADLSD